MVASLRARVHQLEELNAGMKPPQSVVSRMLILQGRERAMRTELAKKEQELEATSARVMLTRKMTHHFDEQMAQTSQKQIKVQAEQLRSLEHELAARQRAVQLAAADTIAARERERKARAKVKQERLEHESAVRIQSAAKGRLDREGPVKQNRELRAAVRDVISSIFEQRIYKPIAAAAKEKIMSAYNNKRSNTQGGRAQRGPSSVRSNRK